MPIYNLQGQPVYDGKPNPSGPGQPDMRELGLPGTLLLSGFILEEENPALQGRQGLNTWKAMAHDPTVKMLLRVLEQPQRAAVWDIEPADESQEAIDLADFIYYNLWEFGDSGGASSFDDFIRQATTGRNQFGFALFEEIYGIDQDKYPGKVCLDRYAWRAQWTRYKWNVEEVDLPDGGRMRQLISMTQWAPPFYQYTVIPSNKFALFVRDMDGENFDGVPLLRSMYKPWYIRDRLYSIQAVGLERAYMGVPIGKLPVSFTANEMKLMQDIVQGLRTHERAGVVLREDMDLSVLYNRIEGDPMQKAIEWHTYEMARSCLAQFTMLGSNQTGSFALSEDQSDLFLMGLNGDANYTTQVVNLTTIPRLIDFNFPNIPKSLHPKLTHGKLGQENWDRTLRALAALAQWGVVVPDDGMEDAVRQGLGLPERDDTITPEYMQPLLESIRRVEGDARQHSGSRAPIPGATNPQAQGQRGEDGSMAPPPVMPPEGPSVQMAELARLRAEFTEAKARMPWRRPKGRLTEGDRIRLRAAETVLEMAEEMRRPIGAVPMRPSERLRRSRRPVVIRENGVTMAERRKDKVVSITSPAKVARKHQAALRDFLAARGKRKKDEHVPLPSQTLKFPLSEDRDGQ